MSSLSPTQPRIEVLGLYSPSANRSEYERFVKAYVDGLDPANFDEESRAVFRRLGREHELVPFDETAHREVQREITYHLSNAVYVEALVVDRDEKFNADDFRQPDPKLLEWSQVAWNPTYLTEDGETVLSGYPHWKVPSAPRFRVVFVIHFWKPHLPLVSSYGELRCPAIKPLPERLWRLAPYEMPR